MYPSLPRLHDYLDHYEAASPAQDAAIFDGTTLSWTALRATVRQWQAVLLQQGVAPGDRVALCGNPRPDFWACFLATVSLGAIWVGLNPKYRAAELRYVLQDCRPRLVFLGGGLADAVGDMLAPLCDEIGAALHRQLPTAASIDDTSLRARTQAVPADAPALIVYTSGTTGAPKGAVLQHRALVRCSAVQATRYGRPAMRMLNNLPINHIGCVGDISTTTLVAGGAIVFMERFDPAGVLDEIERARVSHWGQVPTMFQLTLAQPGFAQRDLSSVEHVLWSGAAMPRETLAELAKLNVRLSTCYGQTETCGSVTYSDDDAPFEQLAETIGRPQPGFELRLADLDENGNGEIQVRGDWTMQGYWNRPEATRDAHTEDGWLKTGDLARARPDGTLVLVGRSKEMFKSGGYNVYPREIELLLESHPAIESAAVVGIPDALYQEVGHAYLQLRPGASIDAETLRDFCKAQLANYKVPKRFTVVEAMPLLPIGKIDRKALAARAAAEA